MTKMRFRPMLYITLVNIIGFLMLFYMCEGKDNTYLYTCLFTCGINIVMYLILYHLEYGDLYLFLTASMLVSIGLIMLCRLDFTGGTDGVGQKQIMWFIVGIVVYFLTLVIFSKLKFLHKLRFFYMIMTFGIIGATLVLGSETNGATNWIYIGSFSVQPSEFIKIIFCLCISCFFFEIPPKGSKKKDKRKKFMAGIYVDEIILCVYVYATMGALAVFQKEWGTALLLFMIYFAMCFVYRTSNLMKLINIGGLVIAAVVGLMFLTEHIGVRVTAWQDPWSDPTNKGHQIIQSLVAIASGGYFGVGIGNGMPNCIPFAESDFIFAAICEEMGMFTGFAIILLYFILAYRGIKIAIKSSNEYMKAVCLSLVIAIGFQTFIIIGGVIKLIPLTGITLPFVSYGGSSMIATFMMIGIMSAAAFYEKRAKK